MWKLLKTSLSEIKDPHSKILLILLIIAISVVFRINVNRYERDKADMRQDLKDCKEDGKALKRENDSLHFRIETLGYINQIQYEENKRAEINLKSKNAKYLNDLYKKIKKDGN